MANITAEVLGRLTPAAPERRGEKRDRLTIAEDIRQTLEVGIAHGLSHGSSTLLGEFDTKPAHKIFGPLSHFAGKLRTLALQGEKHLQADAEGRPSEVAAMDRMLEEALQGNDEVRYLLGKEDVSVHSFYDPEAHVYAVFGVTRTGKRPDFGMIFTQPDDLTTPGRVRMWARGLRPKSTRASRSAQEEAVPDKTLDAHEVMAENASVGAQSFQTLQAVSPYVRRYCPDFQTLVANWNVKELTYDTLYPADDPKSITWGVLLARQYPIEKRLRYQFDREQFPAQVITANQELIDRQYTDHIRPLLNDTRNLFDILSQFRLNPQQAVTALQSLFSAGLTEKLLQSNEFFAADYIPAAGYRYFVEATVLRDFLFPALAYLAGQAGIRLQDIVAADGQDADHIMTALGSLRERVSDPAVEKLFQTIFKDLPDDYTRHRRLYPEEN